MAYYFEFVVKHPQFAFYWWIGTNESLKMPRHNRVNVSNNQPSFWRNILSLNPWFCSMHLWAVVTRLSLNRAEWTYCLSEVDFALVVQDSLIQDVLQVSGDNVVLDLVVLVANKNHVVFHSKLSSWIHWVLRHESCRHNLDHHFFLIMLCHIPNKFQHVLVLFHEVLPIVDMLALFVWQ